MSRCLKLNGYPIVIQLECITKESTNTMATSKKIQFEEVKKMINDLGYQWINGRKETFKNTNDKGTFVCPKHNTQWVCHVRYVVKQIRSCPECKKDKPTKTFGEVLEASGYTLLREYSKNNMIYGSFQCSEGHVWDTQVSNVRYELSGCKACNMHTILLDSVITKISEKNYTLVDRDSFINTRNDGLFRCSFGHEWTTSIYNVYAERSECPICSTGSNEAKMTFIVSKLTGKHFGKTRSVLPSGLEIDAYNEELCLGFEYNGIQHYVEHPKYFHKEGSFEAQQSRDAQKASECNELGITLVVIPYEYNTFNGIVQFVLDAFADMDISTNEVDWEEAKREFTTQFSKDNEGLKRMKAMAERHGGRCLSNEFNGSHGKMLFKCSNPDHPSFETRGYDIDAGKWCQHCAHNAPNGVAKINNQILGFGFEFASNEYTNSSSRYKFKCTTCGDIVETSWDNAKQRLKRGCKKCKPAKAGRGSPNYVKWDVGTINTYLSEYGFTLIGEDYKRARDKYQFTCSHGHIVEKSWENMRDSCKRGCSDCT